MPLLSPPALTPTPQINTNSLPSMATPMTPAPSLESRLQHSTSKLTPLSPPDVRHRALKSLHQKISTEIITPEHLSTLTVTSSLSNPSLAESTSLPVALSQLIPASLSHSPTSLPLLLSLLSSITESPSSDRLAVHSAVQSLQSIYKSLKTELDSVLTGTEAGDLLKQILAKHHPESLLKQQQENAPPKPPARPPKQPLSFVSDIIGPNPTASSPSFLTSSHAASHAASHSTPLLASSTSPQTQSLLYNGYTFPHVTLTPADDRRLMECEVLLGTNSDETPLLHALTNLEDELGVHFPAEVFLQVRPRQT